jgi:elongation factor G
MSTPSSPAIPAQIAAIRTLAVVGQSTSGKTSLVEALLHKAGAIGAQGSLERGTTVTDFDPLERKFLHSLGTSVVHLKHDDQRASTCSHAGLSGLPAVAARALSRRRPRSSSTPPPASR